MPASDDARQIREMLAGLGDLPERFKYHGVEQTIMVETVTDDNPNPISYPSSTPAFFPVKQMTIQGGFDPGDPLTFDVGDGTFYAVGIGTAPPVNTGWIIAEQIDEYLVFVL